MPASRTTGDGTAALLCPQTSHSRETSGPLTSETPRIVPLSAKTVSLMHAWNFAPCAVVSSTPSLRSELIDPSAHPALPQPFSTLA